MKIEMHGVVMLMVYCETQMPIPSCLRWAASMVLNFIYLRHDKCLFVKLFREFGVDFVDDVAVCCVFFSCQVLIAFFSTFPPSCREDRKQNGYYLYPDDWSDFS